VEKVVEGLSAVGKGGGSGRAGCELGVERRKECEQRDRGSDGKKIGSSQGCRFLLGGVGLLVEFRARRP